MKTLLCTIVFLSTTVIAAQISNLGDEPLDVTLYQIGSNNREYASAKGSPYLNENFLPVKIDDFEKTQLVRLNVVNNQIEIKSKTGKTGLLGLKNDYLLNFVDGSSKIYRTRSFRDEKGEEGQSFFEQVKLTDDYGLFLKERKSFIPKKKASGYSDEIPAQFVEGKPRFYVTDFMSNTPILIEIPSKKSKILCLVREAG